MSSVTETTETATHTCLSISVRFITGRCVMTSVSSRDEPEWPPHPGRLFMAMAAAYFETEGTDQQKHAERSALNWLTQQAAPEIRAKEHFERSTFTCYVPVNDNPKPNNAMLQSAPGLPRSRQPRTFPTVIPDSNNDDVLPHVQLVWHNLSDGDAHFEAIDRICRNVVRIGHSSSFVMAWAESCLAAEPDLSFPKRWVPTTSGAEMAVRVAQQGELDRLEGACRATEIDLFAELASAIEESSGKQKAEAKTEFESTFGEPYKKSLRPPDPLPPSIGFWQGYKKASDQMPPVRKKEYFETSMLIFEKIDGPALNVERTLKLTRSLRDTAMQACPQQPPPAWLSGHDPDGAPATTPHAAFLTLPFAGARHADGHIMGLAIALPQGITAEERGMCLGPMIVDGDTGEPKELELWGNGLPNLTVRLSTQPSPPRNLINATWTGPATTWASVTPVVLDKFPKTSRKSDRGGWFEEVCRMVALSCTRAGLPEPVEIDIDTTCWHTGIPRATEKTRRLKPPHGDVDRAAIGEGFPLLSALASRPPKPQVHVWLRFEQKVSGPVLIGSGRFAGYGLCREWKPTQTHG